MSSLESAYQRLERAVDGLAAIIEARSGPASAAANGSAVLGSGLAEEVTALRSECARLSKALQAAATRNSELDRVVDDIHRRLGATIADVDELLR